MEKVYLSRIEPEFAAQLLAGIERLDPRGIVTPENVKAAARNGQCFAATAPGSQAVYIVHVANGVAWVEACKGFGPVDWSLTLLPIIEKQADGCRSVAFQTARRGLVKKAKQQGYQVTGWILKKALP